jgi:hypothetical protein
MYEKYNAFEFGVGGGGGEYMPQIGFGWSNGVALLLLQAAYAGGGSSASKDGLTSAEVIVIASISVFVFLAVASLCWMHFFLPAKSQEPVGLRDSAAKPAVAMNTRPLSPQFGDNAHSNEV